MTQIQIEMPQHDSYGEIMKAYFSLMRGFGVELGMRCESVLTELDGPERWPDLIAQRRLDGRWKGAVNLHDPSITLSEYGWGDNSPLFRVLSPKPQSTTIAKKLHLARNSWLHFSEAPGPAQLEEVANLLRQFASLNELKIESMAARMIKRLQRIRTRQYQPYADIIQRWRADNQPTSAGVTLQPSLPALLQHETTLEVQPDLVIEVDTLAIDRRAPIGGRWTGDLPAARFVLSAIGDLVDSTTGESLRSRVDSEAWPRKRRLWLVPRPMGGVWVDERDGAVGGFVDNVPRLLGYLGDEPDDGLARGFLTPRYYEIDGGRIVDLDSGLALVDAVSDDQREAVSRLQQAVVAVTPETSGLRMSTYGELVAVTDGGAVRVAIVEPEHWFAGHLA